MITNHQPSQFSILLVDDDSSVRNICRIGLRRAGYNIFEADSHSAAREVWATHHKIIDILVTDFDMPGANGLHLAQSLREQKPSLPVLVISGRPIAVPHGVGFLPKPFSLSDLTDTVRQSLLASSETKRGV